LSIVKPYAVFAISLSASVEVSASGSGSTRSRNPRRKTRRPEAQAGSFSVSAPWIVSINSYQIDLAKSAVTRRRETTPLIVVSCS
jgi:hypothetical protein